MDVYYLNQTDMNKQSKGKIKSSKLISQNQKENTSLSDLESLLVSSVRYDNHTQNIFSQSQGAQTRSRPSQVHQSLIKKQYLSNVHIEDKGNTGKCVNCESKIINLNENISLINLKLQEIQSKLNLCFAKYGKVQTRMGDIDLTMVQIQHREEVQAQKLKQVYSKICKNEEENSYKWRVNTQDFSKLKAILQRIQSKQNDRSFLDIRMLEHKVQKIKDQHQYKLTQIIQTLDRLGQLQRKMLNETTKQTQHSTASLLQQNPVKKKYYRSFSICEKSKTNQSTNISYSRNVQFPK